ncbi:hypothetical protein A7E78_00300 [Syntrophotalea acetylenivorans]|uniref:Uncharacterized protein n=1 Tax=Syntrophotalea acetylenivorans TaxID=1842532 RepID=A0A1L3GKL1_9BACT|nr:hypothetical protein [Syntrophotalea acetylenivorans]APG26440.1 hypothetical protein A7E78_00300 [Syntrophotalea acetylenivorans]
MNEKLHSCAQWLPHYLWRSLSRTLAGGRTKPRHIYFAICDHFEPYWGKADKGTARKRLQRWLDEYPKIAEKYRDSDGEMLKYSFFYPEEEYQKDDLDALAELCHAGYGEVEVHLHHDNDTSENLRRTLLDYKKRLHEEHGLLSVDKRTGEIAYGFIHGNWALDNSRPDGRWCGVNDEISILQQTGCYGDFTMPSAPSNTQTRKINSIYYAVDDPQRPKSHNWGRNARVGNQEAGLLMVQGPLSPAWHHRKWGLIPRIENSGLAVSTPLSRQRVRSWIDIGVHVQGAPEHVFVKLYAHGTQEKSLEMFFDQGGMSQLLELVQEEGEKSGAKVHFVSAREMVNVVQALEEGMARPEECRNSRFLSHLSHQVRQAG